MPKTRLQNIIFTLIMAFVMVYAMVCYNIALDKGGMTNEIFLLAFHEIPIMWPIACILEYFAVEKLSRNASFRDSFSQWKSCPGSWHSAWYPRRISPFSLL